MLKRELEKPADDALQDRQMHATPCLFYRIYLQFALDETKTTDLRLVSTFFTAIRLWAA